MLEAPLKQVHIIRLKSCPTGKPFEYNSSSGTTVQPRRTPVNPALLENDETSIATYIVVVEVELRIIAHKEESSIYVHNNIVP